MSCSTPRPCSGSGRSLTLSWTMTLTPTLTSPATLTSTPSSTLHFDSRATQPSGPVADNWAMLSFQRLEVYQRSIEFLALAIEIIAELPAKGHADIADQLRRAVPAAQHRRGCGPDVA